MAIAQIAGVVDSLAEDIEPFVDTVAQIAEAAAAAAYSEIVASFEEEEAVASFAVSATSWHSFVASSEEQRDFGYYKKPFDFDKSWIAEDQTRKDCPSTLTFVNALLAGIPGVKDSDSFGWVCSEAEHYRKLAESAYLEGNSLD